MKYIKKKTRELVSSGQLTQIKLLHRGKVKKSAVEKIKKKLKTYEMWGVTKKNILFLGEPVAPLLAVWKRSISVETGNRLSLFYILYVFIERICYKFAIPGDMSDIKKLPDLQISSAEVDLLIKMANQISGQKKNQTVMIKDIHPAKKTVSKSKIPTAKADVSIQNNPMLLSNLLASNRLLDFIVMAVIDIQLHSVKLLRNCPHLLYSIYADKDDRMQFDDNNEWGRILSALSISNERSTNGYSPIRLQLDVKNGWDNYQCICGRFFFVSYREKANLNPILNDYGTAIKNAQSGDSSAVPTYSQSLLCGPSILNYSYVAQFQDELTSPKGINEDSLRLLRAAISQVINVKTAKAIRKKWHEMRKNPENSLKDGQYLWRRALVDIVSETWFLDTPMRAEYIKCWEGSIKQEEYQMVQTEQILMASFNLLADMKSYSHLVLDSEGLTKAEVEEELSSSYVAFSKTLSKNDDAGKPLLCFTKASLLRFLQGANMEPKFLPAFIDRCKEKGVYSDRKNISIKGKTIDVEAFYVDELKEYKSEVDR